MAATATFVLAATAARAAPPPSSAQKAEREALVQALLEVLARPHIKASQVGVHVQSLDTGEVVFQSNADALLNPASNVKLVTAAAALVTLGPEYRFETEFHTEPELGSQGKARVLYVRGKGDPTLTTERLYGIVGELVHQGVKEVGDIVVDDTWFDAERTAPGFDQEDTDRAYMAPTGAVSLNWNTVGIYLRAGSAPGQKAVVEPEPASDYFAVDNRLTTGSKRTRRFSVASEPAGDRQRLVVKGVVPFVAGSVSVWKKIDNPPMYFGQTLKALLQQRGVKVKGRVRLGAVGPQARLLWVAQSETFDLVLKRLNKLSSNFVAEQLLKTMGAEVQGAPGSFQKGVETVEAFLEREVGIPRGAFVMKNGSGLNDTNRFSAAQLDKLLRYMYQRFPLAPEYLSSLGIAGKDGTLKYRFEGSEAVGRLRAKTGTLENVSALSGYVQSAGGEKFSFSLMVNDYKGRSGPVVSSLDALGTAIAAVGGALSPSRAVAQLASGGRPAVSPLDEVKTRVRTYLALGRQADPRNIGFLRTAWRNEKDPAVRAVVAESLYQSNPQDFLGARALLDSFSAGEDVYGRLRQVARELSIDVPGVSSVVELAAGGSAEALGRLVELARAARAEDKSRQELAQALGEVARTSPEELVLALKGAAAADREAATLTLAEGLAKAGEDEHPFWKALKKGQGGQDAELAAFSRVLDGALGQALGREKAPPPSAAGVPLLPVVPIPVPDAALAPTAETRPGG